MFYTLKPTKCFPIIEPILKAYGIPEDFKFIPAGRIGLKRRYIAKRRTWRLAVYAGHRTHLRAKG
jgi:hypothetical protein